MSPRIAIRSIIERASANPISFATCFCLVSYLVAIFCNNGSGIWRNVLISVDMIPKFDMEASSNAYCAVQEKQTCSRMVDGVVNPLTVVVAVYDEDPNEVVDKILSISDQTFFIHLYLVERNTTRIHCFFENCKQQYAQPIAKYDTMVSKLNGTAAMLRQQGSKSTLTVYNIPNMGTEALAYVKFIADFYSTIPTRHVAFIHGHLTSWHSKVEIHRKLQCARPCRYTELNDLGHGYAENPKCIWNQSWSQYGNRVYNRLLDSRLFSPFLWQENSPPPYIIWNCCAQFLVSTEAIHRLSETFWKSLLSATLDGTLDVQHEYIWRSLFTLGDAYYTVHRGQIGQTEFDQLIGPDNRCMIDACVGVCEEKIEDEYFREHNGTFENATFRNNTKS
ncbi:hypothetical protein CYMTET_19914 [Cymbomonas tetramitiformis]|uniref:Uncharacterized protein n=1 Tax=Cymbomonas tetramitiformis TaxID=36881 RepID=A0AAE0L4R3_9CHLO|nr:hypothetical protein CYMTET_19914 [Cymbomonas tetramitiformis]